MMSRTKRLTHEQQESARTLQAILGSTSTVTMSMAQKRYANAAVYWNDDAGGFVVRYDVEAGEELVPGFVAWTTIQDSVERLLRPRRLREARAEAAKILHIRHRDFVALDDRA